MYILASDMEKFLITQKVIKKVKKAEGSNLDHFKVVAQSSWIMGFFHYKNMLYLQPDFFLYKDTF